MFKFIAFKNIDKKCAFAYNDSSYCKSVNDSHEVNEVDIMGICNYDACCCKYDQTDDVNPVSAESI